MNDAVAAENAGTLDFVVRLDPASDDVVAVDYTTVNGSADAGDDYTATSGTLRFSAGETSKTVGVPIVDDAIEGKRRDADPDAQQRDRGRSEGHDGDGDDRGQRPSR